MSTSAKAPKSTARVFTTFKLQALFDAGMAPGIRSRAALALAMAQRGEQISVHGIDAWFKRTDSNYALERPSLDPTHDSYPLPRRRWGVLLDLFDLSASDLEAEDADFRNWCFDTCTAPSVMLLHAGGHAQLVPPEIELLTHAGIEVLGNACLDTALDPGNLRRIRQAGAVVCYLDQEAVQSAPLRDLLGQCHRETIPLLAVALDQDVGDQLSAEVSAVLARHSLSRSDYVRDLVQNLRRCAVPAPNRGQLPVSNWPPPALVTDRPSIAVLPLTNLSNNADHGPLASGITEDVINLLARTPELFVISHSTTRAYLNTSIDYRSVREQLGVRYMLEGTLRASGARLRVGVQLTDTFTGTGIWGDHFDREDVDPFEVQDELAAAILAQLEPQLRIADMSTSGRGSNASSWRLWQEGWQLLFVDAPAPVPQRSLDLFRRALEMDPGYPLAHAGMAVAQCTGVLWGGLPHRELGEAQIHADTAFKALPDSSAVLYAMAMVHFVRPGNPQVPLGYLERAVRLEPGNPMYHGIRGYLLANLGDTTAGLQACRHAVRLSPKDSREPFLSYMLGCACAAAGDYRQGLDTLAMCRQFGDSSVDFIWLITAFCHHQLGDRTQAVASLRRIPSPRPKPFYHWAVREHLWTGLPMAERNAFLELLPEAGIN